MNETAEVPDRRALVSMIGARQHYAVPRAFEQIGKLGKFYTDLWVRPQWGRVLSRLGSAGRRLAGRCHPDLPHAKVSVPRGMWTWNARAMTASAAGAERYAFYIRQGRRFAEAVRDLALRAAPDPGRDFFFGFTSGCLETVRALASEGVTTVVDQIDPLVTEFDIVARERARWPGWEPDEPEVPATYIERVQAEWQAADHVLVNSPWTRQALSRQGVPERKILTVPQAYEGTPTACEMDYDGKRPLRVLWVGTVCLRKGIPYLLEAARALGDSVAVRVVGPVGINPDRLASTPGNVSIDGAIPRSHISEAYRWADVYVLPTMSDGFAMTQLEAMAHGLPVVTTPNCGEVVEHNTNGLIVPAGDAKALESALASLAASPERIRAMARQTAGTLSRFTLQAYAERVPAGIPLPA